MVNGLLSPWRILFVDEIVFCSTRREEVENKLHKLYLMFNGDEKSDENSDINLRRENSERETAFTWQRFNILINPFRLLFSEPKCARGGHIIFLESIFQHSPHEIVIYSINRKSYNKEVNIL